MGDRFWFTVRMLLVLIGLGLPIALVWLSRRLTRGKRESVRLGTLFGACVVGTGILPIALILALCEAPPPGEGTLPDESRATAAPVIRALERYHIRHGIYPMRLTDLNETDLAVVRPLVSDTAGPGRLHWLYFRSSEHGYDLSFSYIHVGTATCTYTPVSQRWKCTEIM